jgi:hypothetical protein
MLMPNLGGKIARLVISPRQTPVEVGDESATHVRSREMGEWVRG